MVGGNGVSQDFALGRIYERRETVALLNELLKIEVDEDLRLLMGSWLTEAAETLSPVTRRIVVLEDTYIILK